MPKSKKFLYSKIKDSTKLKNQKKMKKITNLIRKTNPYKSDQKALMRLLKEKKYWYHKKIEKPILLWYQKSTKIVIDNGQFNKYKREYLSFTYEAIE